MDFRNRDMSKPETFRLLWLREQYSKLRKMLTPEEASDEDIQKLLLGKYLKRRIVTGRFFNNVTEKTYQMSQEDFINLFLNKPYIMSGYGVLFENQDNSENIATDALQYLLTSRKEYKKKMVQSEYGSNEYLYYKVNQQVLKVLANSYYGILGEKNSIFYNPYIQNSITLTGQDLITTAIVATENFLSGNVNFRDTDDVMTFVSNVLGERYSENIIKYIDYPKTRIDVLNYLRSKTKDFDEAAIGSMLSKLGPEDLNRIYYKNNLQELLGNQWFHDRFGEMLRYDYKEEPAPEMKPLLDDMKSKIMEFCYYDYMIQDRFSHAQHDMRKSIITVDTDSTFIDVGNEVKKAIKIYSLNPADEIKKMTVTNIYINIMTEVLKRTFWTVTTNMGLIDRCKPIINMKNEFVYKRIMLTRNKKNYAGIVTGNLGVLLPKPDLDIKGLPIRKTSMPKLLRDEFTDILLNDILLSDEIDLVKILRKYDALGEKITESIKNGETSYLLPKNVEMYDSYVSPDTIEAVRATLTWNALEPEKEIVPPEKINMAKLSAYDLAGAEMENLKIASPERYERVAETVFNRSGANRIDFSRFGMSCVAIPKSEERIPAYLIPMIDIEAMVNNNMTNGYILLESLGIFCDEVKDVKYKSNIIEI